MTGMPQTPQVLASVPKVQKLSGTGPALGLKVPNPGNSVTQHQGFFRAGQTVTNCFPMQPAPQFDWLALAAHYRLFRDHSSASLGSRRVLVQVKDSIFDFVPFHPLFLGLFLSPTGSTKSRKPTV